jgi:hypothetical protein
MLIGKWECGPISMHGPTFDVVESSTTVNRADHTFYSSSRSIITAPGKAPISIADQSRGTWRLDDHVVVRAVQELKFVSSSDPTLGKAQGQAIEDAQLHKKSVYKSRILQIDNRSARSIPVESTYKEAVVESTCKRTKRCQRYFIDLLSPIEWLMKGRAMDTP